MQGIVERRRRRRRRGPVRARWVVVAETLRHKSVHGTHTHTQSPITAAAVVGIYYLLTIPHTHSVPESPNIGHSYLPQTYL